MEVETRIFSVSARCLPCFSCKCFDMFMFLHPCLHTLAVCLWVISSFLFAAERSGLFMSFSIDWFAYVCALYLVMFLCAHVCLEELQVVNFGFFSAHVAAIF